MWLAVWRAPLQASPGATTSTDKSCVEASARVVSAAPATPEATAVSEAGAAVGEAGAAVGEAGAAVPIHGEESEAEDSFKGAGSLICCGIGLREYWTPEHCRICLSREGIAL